MKKIISVILAALMMQTGAVFAEKNTNNNIFSDMQNSENLILTQTLGIISGYEDGTFRPNTDVTRAEAVKTIVKAMGVSDEAVEEVKEEIKQGRRESNVYISGFKDYNAEHWANVYLQIGYEDGIISGFSDGTLRPDDKVTLEQLLTMLTNVIGYEEYAKASGGYPNGYVQWAHTTGITEDLGLKKTAKNATRDEMLTCVANALNAPLCEITSWTILWNGVNAPTLEIKDGTGKDFQSLLIRNYSIYTADTEVKGADNGKITASILNSANFDDNYYDGSKENKIYIKAGEQNVEQLKLGGKYKMYIKVNEAEDKDYELVCAFPIW